jgi:ribonucleoside-diphosphate reductase alpha chain
MNVIKRDGSIELLNENKLLERIKKLQEKTQLKISQRLVIKQTLSGLYDNVSTQDIDILMSEVAASLTILHPDYSCLAAGILVSMLHKRTPTTFSEAVYILRVSGQINDDLFSLVKNHEQQLNDIVVHERDYDFDYFSFKTLERSYLLRTSTLQIIERPQYMFLRVALAVHGLDIASAQTTYDLMSRKLFIHATPTLFNAGTLKEQMCSCFLASVSNDSIEGIYKTLTDCAVITKHSGGIGLSVHNVRARGSHISSTNGKSNGLTSMLRIFNASSRYVDQGGKRKGSIAVYLEPWHSDILEFLDLKKNTGFEEKRARDLFFALWVPDLFMKRVLEDKTWSLMCPSQCKELYQLYGKEFEEVYTKYETEGKIMQTISARDLWQKVISSQIETGTPYIMYKDHVNHKNNQKNLGTIRSSNLCTEIVQYTDEKEVAVCNLASVCLPSMVTDFNGELCFNFEELKKVVKQITINLNKIIDKNYYPIPEAGTSNLRHRPIGIGVQGLADVFAMLKIPFTSELAKQLNKDIFETIYFSALTTSCDLARETHPYSSFNGSPASQGFLQFDLWDMFKILEQNKSTFLYDWTDLKNCIQKFGLKNSLLVAAMPTASTAQIMGNHDSFEPFTSNLYLRRVFSGEFVVNNKHLVRELEKLNLWTHEIRKALMINNGSVQNIEGIPEWIKQVYKTIWEIKTSDLIDMSADRGRFIDQSQSFNIFLSAPTVNRISSILVYAWEKGLKTGMYYLRTKSAANAIQFTVDDDPCITCQS